MAQTAMKTTLPREEINENFVLEAYQIALSADLILSNVPKGRPKEFTTNLENMRAAATELAAAEGRGVIGQPLKTVGGRGQCDRKGFRSSDT